jgi:hypothetical protein
MSDTASRQSPGSARGYRVEGLVQVLILLTIGSMAAAASFTHVHNVAVQHGQPGWLAWADAVVLELMSIATGLEIRRRHRAGQSTGFVLAVLISAVVLSLSAQVVEAERSVVGWLAAALPALGFLALVKIVLSRTPVEPPVPSPTPGQDQDEVDVPERPDTVGDQDDQDNGRANDQDRHSAMSANDQVSGQVSDRDGDRDLGVDVALVTRARQAAADHLAEQGKPITRDQLRSVLRVGTDTATVLHQQVRTLAGRPGLVPVPSGTFTRPGESLREVIG